MTFYTWLERYKGEDSPRGDLQGDVYRDGLFPKESCDYDEILDYLQKRSASRECIAVFKRCWKDYSPSSKA